LLLVVGLPALVAAMAPRAVLLSAIGFTLFTFSVLVYSFGFAMFDAFVLPSLIVQHFDVSRGMSMGMVALALAGGFAKIIGSVMLGVAILRSGAFSRAAAILLIAGGVVGLLTSVPPLPEWLDSVTSIAMLGGLAVAGWQLAGFSYKRAVAANPTTATTSA
jgi:hypothetical protein